MAEIAEPVACGNRSRASASRQAYCPKTCGGLNARIAAMQAMQRTLQDLLQHCQGDARPDCPILDDLAGQGGTLLPLRRPPLHWADVHDPAPLCPALAHVEPHRCRRWARRLRPATVPTDTVLFDANAACMGFPWCWRRGPGQSTFQ